MAEERTKERQQEAFSGKIVDIFTITGQGTFVLLEETIGRPKPGQWLEVVRDGNVLGMVTLTGLEQVQRPTEDSILALRFKATSGIHLERGQMLQTPRAAARMLPEDDFTAHLAGFVPAIGWTTLVSFIVLLALAAVYVLDRQGSVEWLSPAPQWLSFVMSVTLFVGILAVVWLTSLIWLRRLVRT